MTSMEEDISQYYKNQNLISIERMIYKELGFGMDEISAVWRYSPLLYRLKFFFKKEKINAFVKRFAYATLSKLKNDPANEDAIKSVYYTACFTYAYYVVCDLQKLLPPFFDDKHVFDFVSPAISVILQSCNDDDIISTLVRKRKEIANLSVLNYKMHSHLTEKEDKKWIDSFEKPFDIQKNDILSVWPARHIFFCLNLLEKNDFQKEKYNIANNIYATFDFCLFAFFHTRINLCKLIKKEIVRKIEDKYFDFIVKHFSEKIPASEANTIIDSRLAEYEEIMKCEAEKSEKYENLMFSFIQFLSKDFLDSPLNKSISIIEPDETLYITDYIVNLISQLYEQTNAYTEMLQSEYGIN